jgi:putative endonuclease
MTWYCYILKCVDGSLYTGITTDLERRVKEHNNDNKKGAKYTRLKRPVVLKYFEEYNNQSEARIREAAIKNWKREYKLKLINSVKSKGSP